MINPAPTKAQVEDILGALDHWADEPNAISFRPISTYTLKQLQAISDLFDTERIDLNHGHDGEPGYSSWTPGMPGEAGEITVYKDKPLPQQLKLEDIPLGF